MTVVSPCSRRARVHAGAALVLCAGCVGGFGERAEGRERAGLLRDGPSMTEQAVQSINLNVCKKLDNRVTKVIATASHVVMYSLQNHATWVRHARARVHTLPQLTAEPLTAAGAPGCRG